MIHYIFIPIPFIFELYADRWLIHKGKKDLSLFVRCLMIASVSIETLTWQNLNLNLGWMALALCPFMFFDHALNVLRFGWSKWDKPAYTKGYDSWLSDKNPVALLVVRFVLAAGLVVYWYKTLMR